MDFEPRSDKIRLLNLQILIYFKIQIVIGDYGLSPDQERVQFAMWCIFASQLLLSVDLRNIRPEPRALLLNKRALAVSQDPLGIQGQRVMQVRSWSNLQRKKALFSPKEKTKLGHLSANWVTKLAWKIMHKLIYFK